MPVRRRITEIIEDPIYNAATVALNSLVHASAMLLLPIEGNLKMRNGMAFT
jgi:hypothetical protein